MRGSNRRSWDSSPTGIKGNPFQQSAPGVAGLGGILSSGRAAGSIRGTDGVAGAERAAADDRGAQAAAMAQCPFDALDAGELFEVAARLAQPDAAEDNGADAK